MSLMLISACTDSDLHKVAVALNDTAASIGTLQTTVIEAHKAGLIPDDSAREILTVCVQVSKAGKDAVAITRELTKLTSPTKAQILGILTPVIKAVGNMVDSGLLGIKNEATRDKVKLILLAIQTSLNGAQIILAGTS
jgi:hypothetical protein